MCIPAFGTPKRPALCPRPPVPHVEKNRSDSVTARRYREALASLYDDELSQILVVTHQRPDRLERLTMKGREPSG
jgi:hypothetical protein